MLISKEEIKNYIPHRSPFLFVDSIESVTLPEGVKQEDLKTSKDLIGTKVIAHFKVTDELEILKGHFPGNPILPGVVQVEMMAQAAVFVSHPLVPSDLTTKEVETVLISVESAKFRKPIVPEMDLVIKCEITKCRGTIAYYDCVIESNGEKVSEATVMAKLDIKNKE